MTVEQYTGPGAVEPYDPTSFGGAIPGLEDFDANSVAVPRWSIDHDKGVFKDSLTNEERTTLDVVILGKQTQRALWPAKMGDSDSPLCKSRDGLTGYPLLEANGSKGLVFPWEESVFEPGHMTPDVNSNGTLPCASCNLKDWGGDKKNPVPPICTEQYTFIVCDEEGGGQALFTTQRTGLKSAKKYITDFVRSKRPMFTVVTSISLLEMKSGKRAYQVPEYRKLQPTDQMAWGMYADTFRSLQAFITQPPRSGNTIDGDGSGAAAATTSTGLGMTEGVDANPAAIREIKKPPMKVAPKPVAKPAPVESFVPEGDDEPLPF